MSKPEDYVRALTPKEKEIVVGRKISKRYAPPTVNNDYNAEWHVRGVCTYLRRQEDSTVLGLRLIGKIKRAMHKKED